MRRRWVLPLALGATLCAWLPAAADEAPLHRFQVAVTSFSLEVGPSEQTVPAGVPARVRTRLSLPDPAAPYAATLRSYIRQNYIVRAELYPPAAAADPPALPAPVECAPGDELVLDDLADPGEWLLRNIRLVSRDTGRDFLYAQPDTVTVHVGGDLFLAWVSAEPMTLVEMAAAGVVFDENSYQNYHFVVAFEVEGQVVEFAFPVVNAPSLLPVGGGLDGPLDIGATANLIIGEVNLDLSGIKIPGLPATDVRLPGLIIIPGSVGFLHQHFDVTLVLCNALPPSTGYVLADLTATAALPAPGECTPETDPLCLATLSAGGNDPAQPVAAAGGGRALPPGVSGGARWIVVGQQPGYHEFPIRIQGRLAAPGGEPSWPISGEATAGVAVRPDPRFSITFIHPDRVERGAEYWVTAGVTNASATPANGFRLALDPDALTGVTFLESLYPADNTCPDPPDPAVYCRDTLAPGETVLLKYRFRSLRSGLVTATYAGADAANLDVAVRLEFGVDAAGMPMNPDRLVLPAVAAFVDPDPAGEPYLYDRALAFLGLCHTLSVMNAGIDAGSFQPVAGDAVRRLALALAEAGLAIRCGMDPPAALALFLHDLAGAALADPGVRHALEHTPRGEQLKAALAARIAPDGTLATLAAVLAAHDGWAGDFTLLRTDLSPVENGLPAIAFPAAGETLLWVSPTPAGEARFSGAGARTLRLYRKQDPGTFRQAVYDVELGAGDLLAVPPATLAGTATAVEVRRASNVARIEPSSGLDLPLEPFRLIQAVKVTPDLVTGADPFGRSLFCLLNRRVSFRSPDAAAMFACPGNDVLLTAPIASGRLVGVAVNRPVGKYLSGAAAGQLLVTGLPAADGTILPDQARDIWIADENSPYECGARVEGWVRYPDGRPVAAPAMELWVGVETAMGIRDVCISRFTGGAAGEFRLDFVYRNPHGVSLRVSDPLSGVRRRFPLVIQACGQELHPEILLFGSGTVAGEVVDQDGAPAGGLQSVRVAAEGDGRSVYAVLEGSGRFRADGVAVGAFQVTAMLWNGLQVQGNGYLERPGETAAVRLVVGEATLRGRVVEVIGPEWQAVADATVVVSGATAGWKMMTRTDWNGRFSLTRVPAGNFTVLCIHPQGNRMARATGHIDTGQSVEIQLEFTGGGILDGQVVTRLQNGQLAATPFAAVSLEKLDPAESFFLSLAADLQGQFHAEGLPVGQFRVIARDPRQSTQAETTLLIVTGNNSIQMVLPGTSPVDGVVLTSTGLPAGGATISFAGQQAHADGSGRFMVHLPPGYHSYQALLNKEGVNEAESGALKAPAAGEAEIRLRGQRVVTGTVRDQNGNGVRVPLVLSGLEYSGTFDYKQRLSSTMSADVDGGFSFAGIWDGPFEIRFEGNTFYYPQSFRGTARPGPVEPIILDLAAAVGNGTLHGTLLAWDGESLTSARTGIPLTLTGSGGEQWDARTTVAGYFSFADALPKGRYTLEAEDLYTVDRAWQEVQFPGAGEMDVTLAMLGKNTLQVHVFDAAGQPQSEARLSVARRGLPEYSRLAETVWDTDFSGGPGDIPCYRLENVWEGSYTVTAAVLLGDRVLQTSGGVDLLGNGHEFELNLVLRPTVTVRGAVYDGQVQDGFRVPGAEVSLQDRDSRQWVATAVTDWEMATMGRFEIPAVPVGHYSVEALDYATGKRAAATLDIDDPAGGDPDLTLILEELGSLEGVVLSAGDPGGADCHAATSSLANLPVTVEVRPSSGSPYPERSLVTTTDGDGRFSAAGMPAGRIAVRVSDPATGRSGYAEADLVPDPQTTACVVVELAAVASVSGHVLRPGSAEPVPFAILELSPQGWPGRTARTVAAADGTYSITNMLHGPYRLAAWSGSGVNRAEQAVDLAGDTVMDVELRGVGSVRGRVWNQSHTQIAAGVQVDLEFLDGPDALQEQTSDADGWYFFPEAAAGRYRVHLADQASGLVEDTFHGPTEFELADGQNLEGLEVRLEAVFILWMNLIPPGGGPVIAAVVHYRAVGPGGRTVDRLDQPSLFNVHVIDRLPMFPGVLQVEAGDQGRLQRIVDPIGFSDGQQFDLAAELDPDPPVVTRVAFRSGGVEQPAVAVPLDSAIVVTFNDEMDTAWAGDPAHAGWVGLERQEGQDWTHEAIAGVTWTDTRSFELIPAALADSCLYRITVLGGLPDSDGNPMGQPWSVTFRTVDLTPPSVTTVEPADGSIQVNTVAAVRVLFSEPVQPDSGTIDWRRDSLAEVVQWQLSPDGAILTLVPAGGLQADSRYQVTVSGFLDAAGNIQAEDRVFRFDTVDTQPPEITATICGGTLNTGQPELRFELADALRGVDPASSQAALAAADGTPWALTALTVTAQAALFQPAAELPDGDYVIHVGAADTVGNATSLDCPFRVQTSAVEFLGHAPAAALVTDTDPVEIAVDFRSLQPAAAWTLLVNGEPHPEAALSENAGLYRLALSWAPPADGPVAVRCQVQDETGFTSPWLEWSFLWDGQPPEAGFTSPAGLCCERTPAIAFFCSDTGTGVAAAGIRVLLDGEDRTAEFTLTATGGSWNGGRELDLGPHEVQANVPDGAGHTAVAGRNWTIDDDPPGVRIDRPAPGEKILADTVVFDLTLTDGCGLDEPGLAVEVNGAPRPEFVPVDGRIRLEVPWDHAMLAVGDNTLRVRVRDSLGNQADATRAFQVVRTVSLPYSLTDANGYAWTVAAAGELRLDPLVAAPGDTLLPSTTVWRDGQPYVPIPATLGAIAAGAREVRLSQDLGGDGVAHEKRLYVGAGGYFARAQEWLENPTAQPVTVTVRQFYQLPPGLGWSVTATSSGDTVLDGLGADQWAIVDDDRDEDDAFSLNMPALGLLFHDGEGAGPPDLVETDADGIALWWTDIQVPAGIPGQPGRIGLATAVCAAPERSAARAAVERLVRHPAELFAGLPDDRWAEVRNMDLAAGPDDGLPALPALSGVVSGNVVDGTPEAHPEDGRVLLLRGANPAYRRCRVVTTDATGAFTFPASGSDPRIPVDNLEILEPCGYPAGWPVALTIAQPAIYGLDLIAAGTGALAVTVHTSAGGWVANARVALAPVAGGCPGEERTGWSDPAPALFAGLPPGDYTLDMQSAYGTANRAVTVAPGATGAVDIVLTERFLSGRIVDGSGAGVEGAAVWVYEAAGYHGTPLFQGVTDAAGNFVWLNPPGSQTFTLLALRTDGRSATTVFSLSGGESQILPDLPLIDPGALHVQAFAVTGEPLAGAQAQVSFIQYALPGYQSLSGPDGLASFPALPAELNFTLTVTFPSQEAFPSSPFTLAAGETRVLTYGGAAGTYALTGTVVAGDNTSPVHDKRITLEREVGPGQFEVYPSWIWTDAAGRFDCQVFLPTGRGRIVVPRYPTQGGGQSATDFDAALQTDIRVVSDITVATGAVVDDLGLPVASANSLAVVPFDVAALVPGPAQLTLAGAAFTVLGLGPGQRYDLSATDGDGGFHCAEVLIPDGQLILAGVPAGPCTPRTLTGTVLAADGATPVFHGIRVRLDREIEPQTFVEWGSTLAGADGTFAFTGFFLPTGRGRLRVECPASQHESSAGEREFDFTVEQDVAFVTGITVVTGAVRDAGGQVVADALDLHAVRGPEALPAAQIRLSAGLFTALGLMLGEYYDYTAADGTGADYCARQRLEPGQRVLTGGDLSPCGLSNLTVVLLGADGTTPVPDTTVTAWRELAPGELDGNALEGRTGLAGSFVLSGLNLPTGRLFLQVTWPDSQGWGLDDLWWDTAGGTTIPFISRISVVRGAVTDALGIPAPALEYLRAVSRLTPVGDPAAGQVVVAGGEFTILGLRPGARYDLTAREPAGAFHCASAALALDAFVRTGIVLAPCPEYAISGHLLAADGQTPVTGRPVFLEKEDEAGRYYRAGATESDWGDGAFAFPNLYLPAGRARLAIQWPESQGPGGDTQDVDGAAGGGVDFVTRVSVVKGEVVDADGNRLPDNFMVSANPHDRQMPSVSGSGPAGRFTIAGLRPGMPYDFTVCLDYGEWCDPQQYGGTAGLGAGQFVLTDIRLGPAANGRVSGTVVGGDGVTPVPAARVQLEREFNPGQFELAAVTRTDAAGEFDFAGVILSSSRIRLTAAWPDSQGPGQDVLDGDAGEGLAFFTRISVVTGEIQDAAGDPVEVWDTLSVLPFDPAAATPAVFQSGGLFAAFGLRPGLEYGLAAEDPDGTLYWAEAALAIDQYALAGVILQSWQGAAVTGTLRAADGTTPLRYCSVDLEMELLPGQYQRAGSGWTDENGRFSMSFGDPGGRALRLAVSRPPNQGGRDLLALGGGPYTDLEFVTGITVVRGRAVDAGGGPVADIAAFQAIPRDPAASAPPDWLTFAPDGSLLALGLPPGEPVDLAAVDTADTIYGTTFTLPAGMGSAEGVELTPRALSVAAVWLRVVDAGGAPRPVVAVSLTAWSVWFVEYQAEGWTDADGWVVFPEVPAGIGGLTLSLPGAEPGQAWCSVPLDEPAVAKTVVW